MTTQKGRMIALIMAGGAGTRFWPMSRNSQPKQFLALDGNRSMIQLTVDRLLPIIPLNDIYIVTAKSQVLLVKKHLPALAPENIIIEPFGMNTAPCIALSTEYLKAKYAKDTAMIVLPADHIIKDQDTFIRKLHQAVEAATKERLITFGIVPDYPATGYGYIEAGDKLEEDLFAVKRFKEKPDLPTAKSFLAQGGFYWNSGMFCWSLDTISNAFATHLPQVNKLCLQIAYAWQQEGLNANIEAIYRQMPRVPIDIGIMEKAEARCVIPADMGWSDVGSWKALAEIIPTDIQGNFASAPLFSKDARNNFIKTNKFTAVIGLDNICVVETDDALLIVSKDRSEDVKYVVEHLKQEELTSLL
ncbi:MAG: mannose-1-phosphate guanylyltransferase [Candidatus Cloacimonetes bacterium]|nr:mannose-1-phosphate guanylyltransferase [Candidatus Cloacimonadota bacterium]